MITKTEIQARIEQLNNERSAVMQTIQALQQRLSEASAHVQQINGALMAYEEVLQLLQSSGSSADIQSEPLPESAPLPEPRSSS